MLILLGDWRYASTRLQCASVHRMGRISLGRVNPQPCFQVIIPARGHRHDGWQMPTHSAKTWRWRGGSKSPKATYESSQCPSPTPPHPTPPSWAKCKRRRGWQTADLSPDLLFLGTAHVSDLRHCGDRLDVGGPGVEEWRWSMESEVAFQPPQAKAKESQRLGRDFQRSTASRRYALPY